MNNLLLPVSRPRSRALFRFIVVAGIVPMLMIAATNPDPAARAGGAAAEKTHTLYLGADFSVQWEGQLRPVQDVQGSTFIVGVNGKSVAVPSRLTDLQIKMDDALKISPRSVEIARFKAERAYTAANNPMRKLTDSIAMSREANAKLDGAINELRTTESQAGLAAASSTDKFGNPTPSPLDSSALSAQNAAVVSSGLEQGADLNLAGEMSSRSAQETSAENYDAFSLSFDISAAEPLSKPYVIVVTRYRERSEKAAATRIWIYAEALPRVEAKPTRIRLFRGGFPAGYALDDVQLHLYDQGGEIATNLARKRLPITAEEAFQFAVVDYVGQHRTATLRPILVVKPSPAQLRARLSTTKMDRTFYVKVGKDGKPLGAFADAACTSALADPEVEAVVQTMRFHPALDKGRPVEGTVPVHLGDTSTM